MYFTLQEPLNDRLDAAMCTGTGYVVRRKALENIGGWPLAETGEDFMCSSMLSDYGWKIASVRETLQSGLAPGSLQGLIKQRMRWVRKDSVPILAAFCESNMQTSDADTHLSTCDREDRCRYRSPPTFQLLSPGVKSDISDDTGTKSSRDALCIQRLRSPHKHHRPDPAPTRPSP